MTWQDKLRKQVERQARRMQKAERDRDSILGQTVFLGTLGLLLVLPMVLGVYAGHWLDRRDTGHGGYWTVVLLLLGLVIGAVNVYLFLRSRD
ncbi:MAG TPA: F0F1 ATP synthase subunit [Chromatiales bacterium]|nr:F0F1 ATP synthase subunit [Chromatiales bacterium]